MPDSFFIITTVAAGAVAILFLLITGYLWIAARKEGRYMIGKGFGGKGLDLLRHQPMSNKISLVNITWAGRLWKMGKEGLLFGMDKIASPSTEADAAYNQAIDGTSTWSGCGRPVVIATDLMSTIITPAFYEAVAKEDGFTKYPKAKEILEQVAAYAKENKLQIVTYMQSIKPDLLKTHMKDIGPKHIRDSFLKGAEAQKLADTKPPREGGGLLGGGWIWYLLIGIVAVVLVYFGLPFIQTLIKTKP